MPDPLTALSLAGNIIQLVQFTGQLSSFAQEVRSTGGVRGVLELRSATISLLKGLSGLKEVIKAQAVTSADVDSNSNSVRHLQLPR